MDFQSLFSQNQVQKDSESTLDTQEAVIEMDNDYLIKKPPLQALFLFSLPMIIGNLFQQTYTMVDSAIVGRYVSEQALAAVGASYALTNIFICVAIGGGIGASVIVSRCFGAKEYGRMKTAVFTALLSFLGISLCLGVAGLVLGNISPTSPWRI